MIKQLFSVGIVSFMLMHSALAQTTDSYFNDFDGGDNGIILASILPTNPEGAPVAEPYAFSFENDELVITVNKTEWYFVQNFWTEGQRFNLCEFPYIRFKAKSSQALPIRVQLQGSEESSAWKTQDLIADGEYHEYLFDFSDQTEYGCEEISEIKFDIGGYIPPGSYIDNAIVSMDDYAIGFAAAPKLPEEVNNTYVNDFSGDNTEFVAIPGDLAQLTINANEELEIDLNKQQWWFFQDFFGDESDFNMCEYPYVSFMLKTSDVASSNWRVSVKSIGGDNGISAGGVTKEIIGDGNYALYTFDFTDKFANAPEGFDCSRIREIQIDPGGNNNNVVGLFVMDDYKLGKAAFPGDNFFPTINGINDIVLTPGDIASTVTVPLTGLSDGGDGGQILTVTATSDNQALLPDAGISASPVNNFEGTLFLDFIEGESGVVNVTVTITDDGTPVQSKSTTFQIQVFSKNGYANQYNSFNEEPYWSAPKFYNFTQEEGQMILDLKKRQPEVIWGVFALPVVLDISENPGFAIKATTNRDVNFDVRLTDTAGVSSDVIRQTIRTSSDFLWYEYDFSSDASVNLEAIQAVEFIPNGWQMNGMNRTTPYDGTVFIDEIAIGSEVELTGLSFLPIKDQVLGINSTDNEIVVSDLSANITGVEVTTGDAGLLPQENIAVMQEGEIAYITYTPTADTTGVFPVTFEVTDGTLTKPQTFLVTINDNNAPGATPPMDQELKAGESYEITLRNIDDGNPEASQDVRISVISDNTDVLPNPTIQSESGDTIFTQSERNGIITLNPSTPGQAEVTVILTDGEGDQEITSEVSFIVNVFQELNEPPTINPVLPQQILVNELSVINLTGISDGGDGSESLTISVTSSDTTAIHGDDVSVSEIVDGQATLSFTAVGEGAVNLTITVTDDGGEEGLNNGDQSVSTVIHLDIIPEPITGEIAVFAEENFTIDTDDGSSYEVLGDTAVVFAFTDTKRNWNGHAYQTVNQLNLTNFPYVTFEAKVDRVSPNNPNARYNVYLWDSEGGYTTGATSDIVQQMVPVDGEWHRVTIDWTDNMVQGSQQVPINAARITRVFFHIEGGVTGASNPWVAGDYYIRDLRIGSEVTELVGEQQVLAYVNPVGDQLIAPDGEPRDITVSGIRTGNGSTPSVSVTNSNDVVGTTTLGDVVDGRATITFTPSGELGSTSVTVEVTGEGVDIPASTSFTIDISDPSTFTQSTLSFNRDEELQIIQGFGAFYDRSGALAPEVVNDLGLTIIRVEIEPEFEPVNDNDDPSVVNFDGFDYNYIHPGIQRYKEEFEMAGVDDWKVIATAWTPPYWMKYNLSDMGGPSNSAPTWEGTDNKVRPEYYEEYAEFLAAWWLAVKAQTGVEVYAISPQNEPAYSQFYNSAILSPEKFAEVVAHTGPKFEEMGVTAKIFMPEQNFDQGVNGYSMLAYMEALKIHPVASQYVDIIATHGYASDGIGIGNLGGDAWITMKNEARDYTEAEGGPKELWMTETSGEPDNHENGAMRVAGAIGLGLSKGEAQGWVYWTIQSGADENGARYGYYSGTRKTVKYYAAKHYYRFLRPGAQMFEATTENTDIIINAGENPDGTISIIIVNAGDTPTSFQLDENGDIPNIIDAYQSVESSYAAKISPFGGNRLIIPALSITTLVADGFVTDVALLADAVSDQNVVSDGNSKTFDVTGIDLTGLEGDVTISNITSSDTSIIPFPEIPTVDDGTATITYTPVEGESGSVTISLMLEGGLLTKEVSATINIDPPVINVNDVIDQEVLSDGSTYTVELTGIEYTGISELNITSTNSSDATVIPDPAIPSITGSTATVSYTPLEGTEGQITIGLLFEASIIQKEVTFMVNVSVPTWIDNLSDNGIIVYPVPANNRLTISSSEMMKVVRVYDLNGAQVLSRVVNAEEAVINVDALSKGIYILKITQSNKTLTGRILVD